MGQEFPAHPRRNGKEEEKEEIHVHTQEHRAVAIECGMFLYLFC